MAKYYKKKKKRTGLGTGTKKMHINVRDQKNCPFLVDGIDGFYCNFTGQDCDLDNCKLKEMTRIDVEWQD